MEIVFRVNRYQTQFTLDKKVDKYKYELSKMDFIEEFLLRNMDHCAEYVISFLDFEVNVLKEPHAKDLNLKILGSVELSPCLQTLERVYQWPCVQEKGREDG